MSEKESLEQLDELIDELEAKTPAKKGKAKNKIKESPEFLAAQMYNGHDYGFVRTVDEWRHLIKKCQEAGLCGFDIETTGKDYMKNTIHGFSLAWAPGCARYVYWEFIEQHREVCVKDLESLTMVPHGGKFDFHYMKEYLPEFEPTIATDTINMLHLEDPDKKKGLKESAWVHLGVRMMTLSECLGVREEDLEGDRIKIDFSLVPPARLCQYGCSDADLTLQLCKKKAQIIRPQFQNLEGIDNHLAVPVLRDCERRGMLVDQKYLTTIAPMFERCAVRMQKNIFEVVGHPFNINAPAQVGKVIYEEMGLTPLTYTEKTHKGSTAADDLEKLAKASDNVVLNWIVEYKHHLHSLSNYVKGTLEGCQNRDGCLHAEYLIFGAPTYRLACVAGKIGGGGLNVQQLPKIPEVLEVELADEEREKLQEAGVEVKPTDSGTFQVIYNARRPFLARPGFYMVSADYQAIEFRLLVNFAGEEDIGNAIRAGEDAHMVVSSIMYRKPKEEVSKDERDAVKALNYGLAYGMQPYGLKDRLEVTEQVATDLYNTYFRTFPKIEAYIHGVQRAARKNGYITTYWGRRRYIDYKGSKSYADRSAINTTIQGSGADVMRYAMVKAHYLMKNKYGDKVHLIATLHDQILFEVANDISLEEFTKDVRAGMEMDRDNWLCPLVVDVSYGPNWGQLKDLKKKEAVKAKKKKVVCEAADDLLDEMRQMIDAIPVGETDLVFRSRGEQGVLKKITVDKNQLNKISEALGDGFRWWLEDVDEPEPAQSTASH